MNIGEQLRAERLDGLQTTTLARILPHGTFQILGFGLNVASPIDQPTQSGTKEQNDEATASTPTQQQKGRDTMLQTQHVQYTRMIRSPFIDGREHVE